MNLVSSVQEETNFHQAFVVPFVEMESLPIMRIVKTEILTQMTVALTFVN